MFASETEQATTRATASEPARAQVTMAAMTAAAAFRTRGWVWDKTSPRSPSVAEIEDALWSLIGSVVKNGSGSCGSGRLYVEAGEDDDVHISMDLGTLDRFLADTTPLRQERQELT